MKTFKILLTVLILFIILPIAALTWLWRGACVESDVVPFASPQAGFRAESFVKDCGAKLKPATIVRLVESRDGKDVGDKEILILQGKTPLQIVWEKPEQLAVSVPKDAVIVARRPTWQHLQVVFK